MVAASSFLVLHCGGIHLDRRQLAEIPTPAGAGMHCPIPHFELVRQTVEKLEGLGVRVDSESHGVSHGGNRYFGVFGLGTANNDDGYGLVVGLRNSHDKSYRASLALGTRVFVCDNLAFTGDVTISRKHTRWILRDLPRLMTDAVNQIVAERRTMEDRVAAYRASELNDAQAHDLIIRSLDLRIISPPRIATVLKEWRDPSHEEFEPRTAWSLFNAFTEALKEYNVNGVYQRSQPLHGMFDAACGLALAV